MHYMTMDKNGAGGDDGGGIGGGGIRWSMADDRWRPQECWVLTFLNAKNVSPSRN